MMPSLWEPSGFISAKALGERACASDATYEGHGRVRVELAHTDDRDVARHENELIALAGQKMDMVADDLGKALVLLAQLQLRRSGDGIDQWLLANTLMRRAQENNTDGT